MCPLYEGMRMALAGTKQEAKQETKTEAARIAVALNPKNEQPSAEAQTRMKNELKVKSETVSGYDVPGHKSKEYIQPMASGEIVPQRNADGDPLVCPRCKAYLVARVNSLDNSKFYGCSNFATVMRCKGSCRWDVGQAFLKGEIPRLPNSGS